MANATFDFSGLTVSRTFTLPDVSATLTALGNTATGTGSIVLATAPTVTTLTVSSGGATVTAGGLTVTAGGLTVSASGAQITGDIGANSGNILANTVGKGLRVKEGSGGKQGVATLVSGTVTVSNANVTATSRILVSGGALNSSTAIGSLSVPTITASTSFVITSYIPGGVLTQTGDLRTVNWEIFEPA